MASPAARHCSEHPSFARNGWLAEQLRVKSPAFPGQADATHLRKQVTAFRSRPLDAGPHMFVGSALTARVCEAPRLVAYRECR